MPRADVDPLGVGGPSEAGILERCGIVGPESGRVGVARVDAEGLEKLLRRVVEHGPRVRPVRLPESLGEDRADQVGGAAGVGEGLTWRAHQPVFQDEGDGVAILPDRVANEGGSEIIFWEAGRHRHQLPQRDPSHVAGHLCSMARQQLAEG